MQLSKSCAQSRRRSLLPFSYQRDRTTVSSLFSTLFPSTLFHKRNHRTTNGALKANKPVLRQTNYYRLSLSFLSLIFRTGHTWSSTCQGAATNKCHHILTVTSSSCHYTNVVHPQKQILDDIQTTTFYLSIFAQFSTCLKVDNLRHR